MVVEVETLQNVSLWLNNSFEMILMLEDCWVVEYLWNDVRVVYWWQGEQRFVGEYVLEVIDFDEGMEERVLVVVIEVGQEVCM